MLRGGSWSFACPSCAARCRVPLSPPGAKRKLSRAVLAGFALSMFGWQWWAWWGLALGAPLAWIGFELHARLSGARARERRAPVCPRCGFDAFVRLSELGYDRRQEELERARAALRLKTFGGILGNGPTPRSNARGNAPGKAPGAPAEDPGLDSLPPELIP